MGSPSRFSSLIEHDLFGKPLHGNREYPASQPWGLDDPHALDLSELALSNDREKPFKTL
jgi:hypothetical protein